MFKVTFTKNGYIAVVLFNEQKTENDAIESAKLCFAGDYDRVRAYDLDDLDDDDLDDDA